MAAQDSKSSGISDSKLAARHWFHMGITLLCLHMRKNHRAFTLNRHSGRSGKAFPYFSPVTLGASPPLGGES